MRQINIYKLNELSDSAKAKAVKNYEPDSYWIEDDFHKTKQAFDELFNPVDICNLEISGLRLRTWIINNIYPNLEKGKFYHLHTIGTKSNKTRHSKIQTTKELTLTGTYTDYSITAPLFAFVDVLAATKEGENMKLSTILERCYDHHNTDLNKQIESIHEDGHKYEYLSNYRDYEYFEDGTQVPSCIS